MASLPIQVMRAIFGARFDYRFTVLRVRTYSCNNEAGLLSQSIQFVFFELANFNRWSTSDPITWESGMENTWFQSIAIELL
jgi:hypothetical protein